MEEIERYSNSVNVLVDIKYFCLQVRHVFKSFTNRKSPKKQSLPSVPPYHNTERGIGTVHSILPSKNPQTYLFLIFKKLPL